MAKKYLVHIEAERFIHNELGSIAHHLKSIVDGKLATGDREGLALEMTACLTFIAFEMEAKVNFIGWKVFGDAWEERSGIEKKINKLCSELKLSNDWKARPLATVRDLKELRDTLAHGKPEIVDENKVVDVEPEIWDALKGQWERVVTVEFVNQAYKDTHLFWQQMLSSAEIKEYETVTSGGHSLSTVWNETP
ncbi:hypothetical protein [uncultured Shimia sp.]|uniref:hypothetical protein n=1 Tax=uncultured Shimia sp. TaxID=573152 RepID=UPI00261390B0|nr:hypothetical protein [uncultured Shimia sp.]